MSTTSTSSKRPREEVEATEQGRTKAARSTNSYHQLYSHQGAHPTDPNYLFFSASPAMLFLLRGAQEAPYAGVSRPGIAAVAQPQDYGLRPAPVLSLRALVHFYELVNHAYEIELAAPQQLALRTLGAYAHGGQGLSYINRDGGAGGSGGGGGGSSTASALNSKAPPPQQQQQQFPASRLCHFYNTKGGCRRGEHCDYVHVEKDGRVLPPGSSGSSSSNNNNNNSSSGGSGGGNIGPSGGSTSNALELLRSLTKK